MTEETPKPEEAPNDKARGWLYKLEALTRVHNFIEAGKLFHKHCLYCGLEDDRRLVDWSEAWKTQQHYTFDMAAVKIIPSGDLILAVAPWGAKPVIQGAPVKMGRLTVALMEFANKKLLCVHYHASKQPQQQ